MKDRTYRILFAALLVLQGLLSGCIARQQSVKQDAPTWRYAAHQGIYHPGCCSWSGTRDCGDGRRCCAKCPRRCGW